MSLYFNLIYLLKYYLTKNLTVQSFTGLVHIKWNVLNNNAYFKKYTPILIPYQSEVIFLYDPGC